MTGGITKLWVEFLNPVLVKWIEKHRHYFKPNRRPKEGLGNLRWWMEY